MQPTREELLIQSQYRLIERLLESEERWRFALEGCGDGVWDWDIETSDITFSKRWKEMLGYAENEFSGRTHDWMALIHPDDSASVYDAIEACITGESQQYVAEFQMACKDGGWKWILARGMVVRRNAEGKALRLIGTHSDISARKRTDEMIRRQAYYDGLTQLPNRTLFFDRLDLEIRKMQRAAQNLALLFIDLDDFKAVNDSLGHQAGDGLLLEAAQRISECVRISDTVARFGGDEFTVILPGLDHGDDAERVAQQILEALASPFHLGNEQVHISASIGITLFPSDGVEIEVLCNNADQAMYAAKRAGGNRFSYFTPSMQDAAQARLKRPASGDNQ